MAESASPAAGPRYQSLPRRLASGLLLGAVAVVALIHGEWPFQALVAAILLVGLWEFLRMAASAGHSVSMTAGLSAGAVLILAHLFGVGDARGPILLALGVGAALRSFRSPIDRRLIGLSITVGAVLYVVALGLHVLYLRETANHFGPLLIVVLGTWAADTAAFFVGIRFGKTPLAPAVSPKKTVEGLVGGVLGAALVVSAAATLFLPDLGVAAALLIAGVTGILAPIGDLLESLIKRNLQAKDTSRLIPGHGGVLDRIDSLLLTVPAATYLFRWLMN